MTIAAGSSTLDSSLSLKTTLEGRATSWPEPAASLEKRFLPALQGTKVAFTTSEAQISKAIESLMRSGFTREAAEALERQFLPAARAGAPAGRAALGVTAAGTSEIAGGPLLIGVSGLLTVMNKAAELSRAIPIPPPGPIMLLGADIRIAGLPSNEAFKALPSNIQKQFLHDRAVLDGLKRNGLITAPQRDAILHNFGQRLFGLSAPPPAASAPAAPPVSTPPTAKPQDVVNAWFETLRPLNHSGSQLVAQALSQVLNERNRQDPNGLKNALLSSEGQRDIMTSRSGVAVKAIEIFTDSYIAAMKQNGTPVRVSRERLVQAFGQWTSLQTKGKMSLSLLANALNQLYDSKGQSIRSALSGLNVQGTAKPARANAETQVSLAEKWEKFIKKHRFSEEQLDEIRFSGVDHEAFMREFIEDGGRSLFGDILTRLKENGASGAGNGGGTRNGSAVGTSSDNPDPGNVTIVRLNSDQRKAAARELIENLSATALSGHLLPKELAPKFKAYLEKTIKTAASPYADANQALVYIQQFIKTNINALTEGEKIALSGSGYDQSGNYNPHHKLKYTQRDIDYASSSHSGFSQEQITENLENGNFIRITAVENLSAKLGGVDLSGTKVDASALRYYVMISKEFKNEFSNREIITAFVRSVPALIRNDLEVYLHQFSKQLYDARIDLYQVTEKQINQLDPIRQEKIAKTEDLANDLAERDQVLSKKSLTSGILEFIRGAPESRVKYVRLKNAVEAYTDSYLTSHPTVVNGRNPTEIAHGLKTDPTHFGRLIQKYGKIGAIATVMWQNFQAEGMKPSSPYMHSLFAKLRTEVDREVLPSYGDDVKNYIVTKLTQDPNYYINYTIQDFIKLYAKEKKINVSLQSVSNQYQKNQATIARLAGEPVPEILFEGNTKGLVARIEYFADHNVPKGQQTNFMLYALRTVMGAKNQSDRDHITAQTLWSSFQQSTRSMPHPTTGSNSTVVLNSHITDKLEIIRKQSQEQVPTLEMPSSGRNSNNDSKIYNTDKFIRGRLDDTIGKLINSLNASSFTEQDAIVSAIRLKELSTGTNIEETNHRKSLIYNYLENASSSSLNLQTRKISSMLKISFQQSSEELVNEIVNSPIGNAVYSEILELISKEDYSQQDINTVTANLIQKVGSDPKVKYQVMLLLDMAIVDMKPLGLDGFPEAIKQQLRGRRWAQ